VPRFPDALFSDQWHGPVCRRHLTGLLTALPAPSIAELEASVSDT
jgi:hypothetical protein